MKFSLLLLFIGGLLIKGCVQDSKNDSIYQKRTEAGHTAFRLTEKTLLPFTDIIAYTRIFREYVRQTTPDGRDSIETMYLSNIRIAPHSQALGTAEQYHMTVSGEEAGHNYEITFTNPSSSSWDVLAVASLNEQTTRYHLSIRDIDSKTWTVTQSNCERQAPVQVSATRQSASVTRLGHKSDAAKTTFNVKNQLFTINWAYDTVYPSFKISGSGILQCPNDPHCRVAYQIEQPIVVKSFPGFKTIHQAGSDFNFVNGFTAWSSGTLRLKTYDTVNHAFDEYTVTLLEQDLSIAMNHVEEKWTR